MKFGIHHLVLTSSLIVISIFALMIASLFDRGEVIFTDIQKYSGPIVLEQNPYTGSITPDVRLILYSNFTCPNCESFSNAARSAIADKNVVLIWKDLPNDTLNPYSTAASLAGHCAADVGRFWQYHDLLMAKKGSINDNTFTELATQIGLNPARFERCMEKKSFQPIIEQALEEARQLNITTAPTLYIGNDRFATGVMNSEALAERLDILLNEL